MKLPIYMDYNATTPVDPRVFEAMKPWFCEDFGNAASRSHVFGWKAETAVAESRETIANLLGASPQEIVFTSGATESDNLAIKGICEMYAPDGGHIITCMTEHKAVLDTCKYLETKGYEVTYLKPDTEGRVSAQQVADEIREDTVLVTLMLANNETGAVHPIAEIGKVVREYRARLHSHLFFHTDATQGISKIPFNVNEMAVDLLSFSSHKMYGPKGIGALYVRRRDPRVRLAIQTHGGGHERNMRSGTLNTPSIVGFAKACELAAAEMENNVAKLRHLRDHLEQGILQNVDYVKRNGHKTERLCNTANLSFGYIEGESLMLKLRDIAVSSGSACTSASLEPSFVLRAMDVPDILAHSSL
ncbi:MAG: aminotransferase class V-fold PLP-dependent enzyme, partial [Phycisphaerales bacterium]|nr:aminotransferase class V-fold PLP-dependent enzyme [Phycisphaerales bacterium]